jgi:Ca2+-binding EF-hand superfamily protein
MSLVNDNESGFSTNDINFARKTFIHDCPNGRCSKRKFLTFIRQSSLQKSSPSNISIFQTLQNHRQSKKFFSHMFDIYDRNHDGELDFDEYLYALSAITGANRLRTIETLFNFFDIHNQGYITRKDFNSRKKLAAQFLGQSKIGIKDSLLYERAFNTMDLDKDGRISKEEFIQWHLTNHFKLEDTKPMKRRTRLLRNLSTLVDIRGHIKTSSLQQEDKHPVDIWLETSMNMTPNQE